MHQTRRTFLRQSAVAAALGMVSQLPARRLWALVPGALVPEVDEVLLRALALQAVDATRAAGASFADIRLRGTRRVIVACLYFKPDGGPPVLDPPRLFGIVRYGVRALVDGAWGFAAGSELTPDAVTLAARTAVALARTNRLRRPRPIDFMPAPPVADGRWATPIAQDPFAMSIKEQCELAVAVVAEALRAPEIESASLGFQWEAQTQVFASTDGTVVVQRRTLAWPGAGAYARVGDQSWDGAGAGVEGIHVGGYGYEALGAPATLGARMRDATERAVALAHMGRSARPVEVGRYDLVLAPQAMANVLAATVAPAVNMQRALGDWANAAGTSFAAPPLDILGRYQVGSSLFTVHGDRVQPHGTATVGWDDEGVKPETYTFVREGVIVDYHTGRETAAELAEWYRKRGAPLRSHGCAGAGLGAQVTPPLVRVPNLTLEPGPGTITVADLIADTRRGFYVEDVWGGADQQLVSAQFGGRHQSVREIRHGKLGGYVKDVGFQCLTTPFWRSLDALGGAANAETVMVGQGDDPSFEFTFNTVRAVPGRIRGVNVLNLGRTA